MRGVGWWVWRRGYREFYILYSWGFDGRLTGRDRFSAFIFGRPAEDEVVVRVGFGVERLMRVQERLVPYLDGEIHVSDTSGMEGC